MQTRLSISVWCGGGGGGVKFSLKKEAILIIQQSKLTESYQETELTVS